MNNLTTIALALGFALCSASLHGQDQKLEMAKDLYSKSKYEDAYKMIKECTSNTAESNYYKGAIALEVLKDDELISTYRNAGLESMSAFRSAYDMDRQGEYREAIEQDVYFLSLQFLNWGLQYYNKGKEANNVAMVSKGVGYLDGFLSGYYMLGSYESNINIHLRDEYYSSVEQVKYFTALGTEMLGDKDKALMYYEELMEKRYEQPEVYINMAEIYISMGKEELAFETLSKMSKKLSQFPILSLAYAEMLAERGEMEEALKLVKKAKRASNGAEPYLAEARIYENAKDFASANKAMADAKQIDPDGFATNYQIGEYHLRKAERSNKESQGEISSETKQHYQTALQFFKASHRVKPNDADTIRQISAIYKALGDEEKVKEYNSKLY